MLKTIRIIAVLLLFCTGALAESDSFLWKLDKPGHKTSYILGTIHIGKKGAGLPPKLENLLKSTDLLMTEADLGGGGLELIAQLGVMALDMSTTLSSKLGEDYVAKIASQNRIDKEMLEYFRPWFIFAMVLYAIPDGYSVDTGLDMLLTKKAEELETPITPLENPLDTVMAFVTLPDEKLLRAIKYYADHNGEIKLTTKKLVDLYDAGNVKGLRAYMKEMAKEEYPLEDSAFWQNWLEKDILIKRNQNWISVIEAETIEKSAFIAFGAAHLHGSSGILELLKKKGYKLTPL